MADELSRLQCVTKAEFNPASLTTSFQPLNGSGFSDTVKIMKLYNPSTTVTIELSLDGVTAHDYVQPGGGCIIDCQMNHYSGGTYGTGTLNVARGQIIWGRTAANPTYFQMVGYR